MPFSKSIPGCETDAEFKDFQAFIENETQVDFKTILNHSFFSSNVFVEIENFLSQLTIKNQEEKSVFFARLTSQLQENVPEEITAKQLTPLLLQRMVLLDQNAKHCFLQSFLSVATNPADESNSILSPELFKEYVIPIITNIFHVRDMQIRLVLLKFLPNYVQMFSIDQLEDVILPLILLGTYLSG